MLGRSGSVCSPLPLESFVTLRPRVHPVLLAGLVLAGAGLVVVPATRHELDSRRVAAVARMQDVARRNADPAGLVPMSRGECPSQESLVRCMTSPRDADSLARYYRVALAAAAGRDVTMTCETLPFGARPRDCTVRIDRGDHVVMVSITEQFRRVGGRAEPDGSRIRLDAD
jgi:hypothetical protein